MLSENTYSLQFSKFFPRHVSYRNRTALLIEPTTALFIKCLGIWMPIKRGNGFRNLEVHHIIKYFTILKIKFRIISWVGGFLRAIVDWKSYDPEKLCIVWFLWPLKKYWPIPQHSLTGKCRSKWQWALSPDTSENSIYPKVWKQSKRVNTGSRELVISTGNPVQSWAFSWSFKDHQNSFQAYNLE